MILGWLATDVSIDGNYVYAATTQPWQIKALRALLGRPEKIEIYHFTVTTEGLKPAVEMKWRREVLNSVAREDVWVKRFTGAESFDDLIRLRWDAVINAVKEARGRLAKHITCRGEGQCGEEKIGEMLKELEAFVAKVEEWKEGRLRGEEVDKFYKEARKYLAPALLLLELESAKPEERQTALWRFGLAFAAAVAGDGSVRRGDIQLVSGDGGAALLWLAALQKAGELAGFKPRLYVGDRYYRVEVTGMENAAALAALMPAVGLNPKAEKAINMFREWAEEVGAVEVKLEAVEKTSRGAKAVVAVRAGPWEAKYNVYLRGDAVELRFNSADAERAYQMAHVLKLLGVKAEPKAAGGRSGGRHKWLISASTDVLASKAVLPLFREVLARAVEEAARRGWIKGDTAERWAEKLREGVTIAEDKPKFVIRINNTGALDIVYMTTSAENLDRYAERLKSLGLEAGIHFTTKPPKNGKQGTLRITAEGVVKLAELSHHAEDPERRLEAAGWIKHLLARAEESGGEAAQEKLRKLVEEGAARGVSALTGLRREVEVDGERHVVEIRRAEARIEDGKLRIRVEAVVDGVAVEREYTFFRDRGNKTSGRVLTQADAPGGRKEDLKRLKALSTVIFGEAGSLMAGGKLLGYTRRHLEYAMRFREVKEAAERWLRGG
jgi:PaRep2b protein.